MSPTQPKQSARLAKAAQALVGVPYQRQGRTVAGLDCVGLVLVAAQAVGFDLSRHDSRSYGQCPSADDLRARLDASLQEAEGVAVGHIALLETKGLGDVHLGIVAERAGVLTLVHSVNSRGCVVEHRLDSQMRAAIKKTYTLKDE